MRSMSIRLAACVLALGIAAAASAQMDPIVKSICDKWDPAKNAIKDMTMTGTMDAQTPDGAMKMDLVIKRKGEKVRTDINVNGMTMSNIYDGKDSWMITPMGVQRSPAGQPNPGQSFNDTLPADAKVTGSASVSGRDCHVIEYKDPKNGTPVKLWVDKKTLTPVKSETMNGTKLMTVLFSDHRKVTANYEVPYKIDMQQDGKSMGAMTISSVEVNTGLADDLFVPKAPAGGMGMPMMPQR